MPPRPRSAISLRGLLAAALPLAFATALLAPPAARAQADGVQGAAVVRTIHGTIPTRGPVSLRIAAELGNVQVSGGPAGTLTYTIRLRAPRGSGVQANLDAWPISVRREGNDILIATGRGPDSGHTHLTIRVTVPPEVESVHLHSAVGNLSARHLAASLHAVTAAGNITADGIRGPVRVETAGGNILLGALGASVHAATAGGNIELTSAAGPIHLQSQGGTITVGHAGGEAHVATAGGGIAIRSASGPVIAETAGGNIDLGQIAGLVHARSGGGNIRIAAARGVHCQTGGGNIQLTALDGPVHALTYAGSIEATITATASQFGASTLASPDGNITVYLPVRLPVTVEAAGGSGPGGPRLSSDFPQITAAANGGVLRIPLNGGGPVLRIETSNGRIRILKISPR